MKNKHPLRTIKMVLEYDGAAYAGFQAQKKDKTVQSVLEAALMKMMGERVPIVASGRTDAGVHAWAQPVSARAHFPTDDANMLKALNSMLPHDVAVKSLETVPLDFNARRDAKWKHYRYVINNAKIRSPLRDRQAWHVPARLDLAEMRAAAAVLVGEHDFTTFMGSNSSVKTTVRNIISAELKRHGDLITLDITGNGFLRQMVRNIAGTLVEIGRGRMKADDMKTMLKAKDRKKAGRTAPAHALFLMEVGY